MNCARCGAPIVGGRWTIPTARGLLCVCTACVEAPKVMRLFRPAVEVQSALKPELMLKGVKPNH